MRSFSFSRHIHPRTKMLSPFAPLAFFPSASSGFSLFGAKKDSNVKGKVVRTKKGKADEEEDESKKLLQQVKDAGIAGVISYIFWEWAFWGVSIPVCIFGYQAATGHWPDFQNQEDLAKLGAEAFAFVNVRSCTRFERARLCMMTH